MCMWERDFCLNGGKGFLYICGRGIFVCMLEKDFLWEREFCVHVGEEFLFVCREGFFFLCGRGILYVEEGLLCVCGRGIFHLAEIRYFLIRLLWTSCVCLTNALNKPIFIYKPLFTYKPILSHSLLIIS